MTVEDRRERAADMRHQRVYGTAHKLYQQWLAEQKNLDEVLANGSQRGFTALAALSFEAAEAFEATSRSRSRSSAPRLAEAA